ncbi:hypothetical protein J7J95_01850 [bacterium]|nr:hypothetical protein [bacterium]
MTNSLAVFAAEVDLGEKLGVKEKFPTLGSFFSNLLFNAYAFLGIIFLFLLIFGGISVIMGAGSGDKAKTEQGKKAVTAAVLGFVVVAMSYFIVKVIEVVTGAEILNPGF